MRLTLQILAVLVIGTALGVAVTWLAVSRGGAGRIDNGPWQTNPAAGSAQGDPSTRAFIAVHGLFALGRSEAVYYTATTDGDGSPLDGRCRYEIRGKEPDARWWSITAYGADDYLIPNPDHRYSVAKAAMPRDSGGTIAVDVGGDAGGDRWIPVVLGPFSLTLRLYNPGPGVLQDPAHTALPALAKVSCR